MRSASFAAIDCLNVMGTDSLEVGADQVLSEAGFEDPPTAAIPISAPLPGSRLPKNRITTKAEAGRAQVSQALSRKNTAQPFMRSTSVRSIERRLR